MRRQRGRVVSVVVCTLQNISARVPSVVNSRFEAVERPTAIRPSSGWSRRWSAAPISYEEHPTHGHSVSSEVCNWTEHINQDARIIAGNPAIVASAIHLGSIQELCCYGWQRQSTQVRPRNAHGSSRRYDNISVFRKGRGHTQGCEADHSHANSK